ncbi:hypothetical protein Tco_1172463 [Tanacetum coccineum]
MRSTHITPPLHSPPRVVSSPYVSFTHKYQTSTHTQYIPGSSSPISPPTKPLQSIFFTVGGVTFEDGRWCWICESHLRLGSARFVVVMGLIATNVVVFLLRRVAVTVGSCSRILWSGNRRMTLCIYMAKSAETPTAYMTPSSVADSSNRKSKKMHDAMTDPSDGNSESAEDTSGQVDGPSWAVRLGRRVSIDSNATQAVEDLPRGSDNPTQLIASFDK